MKRMIKMFLSMAPVIAIQCVSAQNLLTPVDAGSKVHFQIRNLGIRKGGDFTGLRGLIKFDPSNLTTAFFDVTLDAKTIDTDNRLMDKHLREPEFFDVEQYKTLAFKSTRVTRSTLAGRYYVYGNLTIKGVSRPVEFAFGATPGQGGFFFDGEFEINRRDFGVGGSSITLSDKLKVQLSVFAKS